MRGKPIYKFGDTVACTKTGNRFFIKQGKRGRIPMYGAGCNEFSVVNDGCEYTESNLIMCRMVIVEKISRYMVFGKMKI